MKSNKFNIYCIVEARTSSTRLPNKVSKNLSSKHKVIDFVVQNLINSKIEKKKIILALPKNKKNNELQKYIKRKFNLKVFRGNEKNVYKRVFDCCKKYKIKNFLRITADNVFLDPILINQAIKFYYKKNLKYLSTRTMEHTNKWTETSDYNEGSSIEIINFENYKKVKNLVSRNDCEYPTWHLFSNPKFFKLSKFILINRYKKIISKKNLKKIRSTLDTKEDYNFLLKIVNELNLKPGKNNFLKIVKNFKKIKKYLKINKNINKKIAYKIVRKKNQSS